MTDHVENWKIVTPEAIVYSEDVENGHASPAWRVSWGFFPGTSGS